MGKSLDDKEINALYEAENLRNLLGLDAEDGKGMATKAMAIKAMAITAMAITAMAIKAMAITAMAVITPIKMMMNV